MDMQNATPIVIDNAVFDLTINQINNFWPTPIADLYQYRDVIGKRLERCLNASNNKRYHEKGKSVFSPLHSNQYAIYLYFLANTIYRNNGDSELCTKLFYLNKIMHSVDWYYEISLPDIFDVEHPVGSVMGRAEYSNNFFFFQGCTVGGNYDIYPQIGSHVTMYSNSSILGNSTIGNHVILGAGTLVKDEIIPDYSIVFGRSPNLIVKQKNFDYISGKISQMWSLSPPHSNTYPVL